MRNPAKVVRLALFGVLLVAAPGSAQETPLPIGRVAALSAGSLAGVVVDEAGGAVAGVTVSALGPSASIAVTDRSGRFEMRQLSPGPYVVRARLNGVVVSRGQVVDVRPLARASSSISIRRPADAAASADRSYPVLAASMAGTTAESEQGDTEAASGATPSTGADDRSEVAWRLRHARRSVLKETTWAGVGAETQEAFGKGQIGRHTGVSNWLSTSLNGQVNLLTSGTLDAPQQLFSGDHLARGIAFVALGAPAAGGHADWNVRAALMQGDLSSWIVAVGYATREPAPHQYTAGFSFSTQRYGTVTQAELPEISDTSRSVGLAYGFDTLTLAPKLSVSYGGRLARYDYLERPLLLSPSVNLTASPTDHLRVHARFARRMLAPGAEEFVPAGESALWLPPQRTFSAIDNKPLTPERADQMAVKLEQDVPGGSVSVGVFQQRVADQMAALFAAYDGGQFVPAARAGHYLVANTGTVSASGITAGFASSVSSRVRGTVQYTASNARWRSADDLSYLLLVAPSVVRAANERVHDVLTRIETAVPETSTRVAFACRLSNGFAGSDGRPTLGSRFDLQVRQALPFMDFGAARWEMLVAVRTLFREAAGDATIYDELLVVRPPKRVVGGLTLSF